MSAVPFRLQPCENPTEASLDALTFGDPSLYEKLLTLNRVEILAENPRIRAGTIWYRVDREFCFVEAVAIRSGLYPLVYKVLPEMMAAQLGFSYVGRYFSMGYGYATRSLVWDEKAIAENGARSFASVYPGMIPIVKLTAIIGGSTRTPVLVRHDQDAAGAAADAALLSDPSLANKLAEVARLEVVTGSEGTRAGTIWYFRNGNYCFVIASAFRPEAPAEVARLAPLMAAQLFGYNFVGNYTAIPADLKDKALCWDRYTGTPIPELAPLSERLPGVQDFVVTFADVIPFNPTPDPDPYEEVCESPTLHDSNYEPGLTYDGCHWINTNQPTPCHRWVATDSQHGEWQDAKEAENLHNAFDEHGYNYDGCKWNFTSDPQDGSTWQASSSLNGSWVPMTPYGTELSRETIDPINVNIDGGYYQIGNWCLVTYADGMGGTYQNYVNDYSGWPYGTFLVNSNDYNYYADGNGGYYQGEYTGSGNGGNYPEAGTVVSTDYINNPSIYWEGLGSNGYFVFAETAQRDWHADGSGGTYWDGGYYNQQGQVSDGSVIFDDGFGHQVIYSFNNQFPTYYITT